MTTTSSSSEQQTSTESLSPSSNAQTPVLDNQQLQSADDVNSNARPVRRVTNTLPAEEFAEKCNTRISRAAERHDAARADIIFSEVLDYEHNNGGTPRLPLSLYEHLVSMYIQLRLARRAEQVVDVMPKVGWTPSIRTWTTLLRGSSRIGDAHAPDKFWALMLSNNVLPDAVAYSARVHALIDLYRPEQAMGVLDEMASLWFDSQERNGALLQGGSRSAAHQVDSINAPQPTVGVGNAAIAAIVGKRNPQYEKYIPEVLQWMGRCGLEPDTNTFNPMINNAMRLGKVEEALDLLKKMKDANIPTNSETGRGLVLGFVNSKTLDNLPPEEQSQQVLDVFADIETNYIGTSLDDRAYAIAIDRVLTRHANKDAAEKLLARMRANGLPQSTHIYTILLDFYLQSRPPDYTAMKELWASIATANNGWGAYLDDTFFDRALERFSEHHRVLGIDLITQIIDHLARLGKRPSWPALRTVAQAYIERNDLRRLQALVHDLRYQTRLRRDAGGTGFGYRDFWNLIIDTGLLQEEGITSYQQLRDKDMSERSSTGAHRADSHFGNLPALRWRTSAARPT